MAVLVGFNYNIVFDCIYVYNNNVSGGIAGHLPATEKKEKKINKDIIPRYYYAFITRLPLTGVAGQQKKKNYTATAYFLLNILEECAARA